MRRAAHGRVKAGCIPARVFGIDVKQDYDGSFAAFEFHVGVILNAGLLALRERM